MDHDERLKSLIAEFCILRKYSGVTEGASYWGYLFSIVRRIADESLPTVMAVGHHNDGLALFYNPSMIMNTTSEVILKVLEHEGMHILNMHIPRLLRLLSDGVSEKKVKRFNIASDIAVNEEIGLVKPLKIANMYIAPCTSSAFGLPSNMSAEWYYDALQDSEEEKEKNKEDGKEGDAEGLVGNLITSHSKWKEIQDCQDAYARSRKVETFIKRVVSDSLKAFERNRGSLPAYIQEVITDMFGIPKIPYYQMIQKLVIGTRRAKIRSSNARPHKKKAYCFHLPKHVHQMLPYPGRVTDRSFNIVVILDTSGSMRSEDIQQGLVGVKNIIENDRYCTTTVLEVDTEVNREYSCKKISDIKFNVTGRGGTTLGPGLFRARELNCDVCLVFTDAQTENINEYERRSLPKKIIWVVNGDGPTSNIDRTGVIVRI